MGAGLWTCNKVDGAQWLLEWLMGPSEAGCGCVRTKSAATAI